MSVDLTIKVRRQVRHREFIAVTAKNAQSILNVLAPIQVASQLGPDSAVYIGEAIFDDIICIANYADHPIEFGVVFVPSTPGWEDPEQEGWWFTLTMRASNEDPIKHLLFIAAATALADLQLMPIVDENSYFELGSDRYDPIYILNQFTLSEPQPDFAKAIDKFRTSENAY